MEVTLPCGNIVCCEISSWIRVIICLLFPFRAMIVQTDSSYQRERVRTKRRERKVITIILHYYSFLHTIPLSIYLNCSIDPSTFTSSISLNRFIPPFSLFYSFHIFRMGGSSSKCPSSNEVSITGGKIVGRRFFHEEDKPVDAYQGIPYAKPPVEELRFRVRLSPFIIN